MAIAVEAQSTHEFDTNPYEARVFGRHETKLLLVREIFCLSQTRGVPNPVAEEIKDSLRPAEAILINIPDVAVLDYQGLSAYVNFVNKLWGSNHDIDECPVSEDGNYYLLIAGHTRVESIAKLEEEAALKSGTENRKAYKVECKIYRDMEPMDLLSVQINENISKAPSQDRKAIALVESYYYGLENGSWKNKTDFQRKNKGKFNIRELNNAINFATLPDEIRKFIFAGKVPYTAGVELGRIRDLIVEYKLAIYWGGRSIEDLSEQEKADFESGLLEWYLQEVAHIQEKRMNSTAAKKHVEGIENSMTSHLRKNSDSEEPEQIKLDAEWVMSFEHDIAPGSINDEWAKSRERWRKALGVHLTEIFDKKVAGTFAETLWLYKRVLERTGGIKDLDPVIGQMEFEVRSLLTNVGNVATNGDVMPWKLSDSLFSGQVADQGSLV